MAYGTKRHLAATSHSRDIVVAVNGIQQAEAQEVGADLLGAIDDIERKKEVVEAALATSDEATARVDTAKERLNAGIQSVLWLGTALGATALAARREGWASSSDVAMASGVQVELDRLDVPVAGLMGRTLADQQEALQTAMADREAAKAAVKLADTQWIRSLSVLNCETMRGKHVLVMAGVEVPKRKAKARRGATEAQPSEGNGRKKPATETKQGTPPATSNDTAEKAPASLSQPPASSTPRLQATTPVAA